MPRSELARRRARAAAATARAPSDDGARAQAGIRVQSMSRAEAQRVSAEPSSDGVRKIVLDPTAPHEGGRLSAREMRAIISTFRPRYEALRAREYDLSDEALRVRLGRQDAEYNALLHAQPSLARLVASRESSSADVLEEVCRLAADVESGRLTREEADEAFPAFFVEIVEDSHREEDALAVEMHALAVAPVSLDLAPSWLKEQAAVWV